ncbi:uncharacterized protein BX664DRAFT_328516, partial [Halteromyces radiatus]|uniref:uncharacterized protein n=1 Tax=Halteromyces radiatus TaxID=101107 RepID=UPI00221FD31C
VWCLSLAVLCNVCVVSSSLFLLGWSLSFRFLHLSLVVMVFSSRTLYYVVRPCLFLFLPIWLVSPMLNGFILFFYLIGISVSISIITIITIVIIITSIVYILYIVGI